MKSAGIIALTFAASIRVLFAQDNLVVNGGFEQISTCELAGGDLESASGWYNLYVNPGGVDLYNVCVSNPWYAVPENLDGFQVPKEGEGYAGFLTYLYNEALLGTLSVPLVKDSTYTFIAYISLRDGCNKAVYGLGICFFNQIVMLPRESMDTIQPIFRVNRYLDEKVMWDSISFTFTSTGTENYLSIGLFGLVNDSTFLHLSTGQTAMSYYYLDNVIVRKATPDEINSVRENRLGLQLAPSPTAGPLTIEAKARLREAWVMDMSGRRLWPMQGSGTRWHTDLSGLAAGVYLVEAVAEDGRRAVQKAVLMSN